MMQFLQRKRLKNALMLIFKNRSKNLMTKGARNTYSFRKRKQRLKSSGKLLKAAGILKTFFSHCHTWLNMYEQGRSVDSPYNQ